MTFHNTINLTGKDLGEAIRNAKNQELAVLAAMSPGIARTPSQLHRMFCALGKKWPVTSIRRAVTGLEHDGKLVKLDEMRMGPLGKPEHYWSLPA